MALFEITRTVDKSNDIAIAKKSTKTKKVATTIRGGSNLLVRIQNIQKLVDEKLGHLKDKYILIQDEKILEEYIDKCLDNKVIAIDTETTGLDTMLDEIVGICIYTPNEKGAYIPINHISYITKERVENQLSKDVIRKQFERIKDIDVIMFNANFDIRVLKNQIGLHNAYCTWDCALAQKLLNENEPENKLKPLHQKYVLDGKEDAFSFAELFKDITFDLIPLNTAVLYAGHDPEITYELYDYQRKYLTDDTDRADLKRVYWVFKNIEMPCIDATISMEQNGVSLDLEYQKELSIKYHKILDERLDNFYNVLSEYDDVINEYKCANPNHKLSTPINVSSPNQLSKLFYDILKYPIVNKKKPRSTGSAILEKWDTPITQALIRYREIEKLISTYIDKLPNCINPNDGKVHCNFNQYGAVTGRFSSSDPNLQNIPSQNKDIRPMFIASDGCVLMSSDFSQQEPKCLASLCKQKGDPQMYDTFMAGKDLYSEIASKAFNVPYEECLEHFPKGTPIKKIGKKWYYATEDDYDKLADGETDVYADGKARRTQAKSILLGALYGRGEDSIAEQLGCDVEKAKEIKQSVFKGFPAIKQFEDDSIRMAQEIGYVTTVCGRKRRLPDMQLNEYEFKYKDGHREDDDPLDFDGEPSTDVPYTICNMYLNRLYNCRRYTDHQKIVKQAKDDGIIITDNRKNIADATRQCVNSRIQGSASDLTKLAMIDLVSNERLKELGFKLLIQVHDEVIAECPEENVKECSELLASVMSKSAEKILEMPIKCDVEITKKWYGETIELD